MKQITRLLRMATTRRPLPALPEAAASAAMLPAALRALVTPPALALQAERPPSSSHSYPTPPARASADFTAQVMARLQAAPTPDPRETRAMLARQRMRRAARLYLALIVLSGVALLALAVGAPWVLVGVIAAVVSLVLVAVTVAAVVSGITGGFISGFGVAWLAMLATLSVLLLPLLARRAGRRSSASSPTASSSPPAHRL